MDHKGTQRIETRRLILRRFTDGDAEGAFRNWETDDQVTKYLTWPTYSDPEDSRRVIHTWVEQYRDPTFYQWAIELREIGEPIGSISVVGIHEKTDAVEIGYCIGRRWWHQGLTSEAFAGVISFLFREVGANRIEAHHDTNNPRSGSVMKACGMVQEGTLRQADWNNQGIVDIAVYGLLRSEWEDTQ